MWFSVGILLVLSQRISPKDLMRAISIMLVGNVSQIDYDSGCTVNRSSDILRRKGRENDSLRNENDFYTYLKNPK